MSNRDNGTRIPTRTEVAIEAILLGVVVGLITYLVTSSPVDLAEASLLEVAGIVGWSLIALLQAVKLITTVVLRSKAARDIELPCLNCDGNGRLEDRSLCVQCAGVGTVGYRD